MLSIDTVSRFREGSTLSVNAADRLIVALDLPTIEDARRVVRELDDVASFYKVGLHLQMLDGNESFITELLNAGKQVFVDYKWNDIPETVRGGVAARPSEALIF